MSTNSNNNDEYDEKLQNLFPDIDLFEPFEKSIEILQSILQSMPKDPFEDVMLDSAYFRKELIKDPGDLLKYATKDDSQSKMALALLKILTTALPANPIAKLLYKFFADSEINNLESEGDYTQIDNWGEILGNEIEPLHHLNEMYQAAFNKYRKDKSLSIEPGEIEYKDILEEVKSNMGGQGNWETIAKSIINRINDTKLYEESWKEAINQYQEKFGANLSEIYQLEYNFGDIGEKTKIIEQYGTDFLKGRYGSLFELFKDPNLDRIHEEFKRMIMVEQGQPFKDPEISIEYQGFVHKDQPYDAGQKSPAGAGTAGRKISTTLPSSLNSLLNFTIGVGIEPYYVDSGVDVAKDFVSPGERGYIPTKEELEKLKELQQIPIMINNSADNMSKIKSNTKDAKDNTFVLSHTLSDIARYAGQIGGAFMSVDEEIGKAIGSAGTLTEGVAGIFKAFEGDKVNGLGLMQGIQGGFAGLQGLFGGEPGSDTSQLLGGLGGVGVGVAGILTDNPIEGIASIISSLPSLIDGLFESTQEGYTKQLSKQGFNDTYSEDLLDKMSAVSDQKGDKSFGIKAYIEDFFKETDIDTKDEFSRMSDLLSESIGEYVSQGHTMDEAYWKFGDELEQLTSAQEKYGFETVSSLTNMLDIQKSQTKEGRIEGLQGSLGGYDKIISGIEKQMKLTPDFKLSETSISGIAGSLTNTYPELLNQGMGAGEAVDAVKPLLTEYAGMAEKQGWDLSKVPGFSQLSSYFESLDKASGALDMISGSADVVKALSGSGLMDQATLESQGSLGMDVMNQLEASGLNDTQVLQQMGGWLQSMQQAAEKSGLSLSPEIQALITQAEEKGVLPEEQKPVGEVIAEGIETGFTKAIDVIDKYFGNLTEFGEGGMVPGSSGQRKLIWAHAGEAVGFPEDLSKLASNPELAQGLSGVAGMLAAAMQNTGAMLASAGGGTESIAVTLQNLADSGKLNLMEMQSKNMLESPASDYSFAMGRIARQTGAEMEQKVAAERQAAAESNNLQIAQTIENNMKIAVNGRDFVNAIKQDIYDQLKEDSRRGMITIHDSAIKKY
jgi:tetratricopeptide (TPR) repeat protein